MPWRRTLLFILSLVSACGEDVARVSEGAIDAAATDAAAGMTPVDGAGNRQDAAAADAGPPNGDAGLRWAGCPPGYHDQCRFYELPLDWTADQAAAAARKVRKVRILATRTVPAGGVPDRQIWLLAGGPGQAASGLAGFFPSILAMPGRTQIFTMEHRGVGHSERLSCPRAEREDSELGPLISEAEFWACVMELQGPARDRLRHFSISAAARDLAALIEANRLPGVPVTIVGYSYGTRVALRHALLFPAGADALVLDSISAPGADWFSEAERPHDGVGQRLAAMCARDAFCREKLGDDPWAEVLAAIDAPCERVDITPEDMKVAVAEFLAFDFLQVPMLAMVYRMRRCAEGDARVLEAFFDNVAEAFAGGGDGLGSDILFFNIAFSELWGPYSVEQIEAWCEQADVCLDAMATLGRMREMYPVYPAPALVTAWPQTDMAVVGMNGDLDARTPIEGARQLVEHLGGPGQRLFEMPGLAHIVWQSSEVTTPGQPSCAQQLVADLQRQIASGFDEPSPPCVDDLKPLSFELSRLQSLSLFGVEDAWDGAPAAGRQQRNAPRTLRSPGEELHAEPAPRQRPQLRPPRIAPSVLFGRRISAGGGIPPSP